jgi:hypothetical protein
VDEKPLDVVGLFSDLPPNGMRQFEITGALPGSKRPPLSAIATEGNVVPLFAEIFDACKGLPGFELKIRPLGPATP